MTACLPLLTLSSSHLEELLVLSRWSHAWETVQRLGRGKARSVSEDGRKRGNNAPGPRGRRMEMCYNEQPPRELARIGATRRLIYFLD